MHVFRDLLVRALHLNDAAARHCAPADLDLDVPLVLLVTKDPANCQDGIGHGLFRAHTEELHFFGGDANSVVAGALERVHLMASTPGRLASRGR